MVSNIKRSPEYKEATEHSKRRTELETKQKAELQNLRMRIHRKRLKGEGKQDLLRELRDKEKSYDHGNKRRLGPTPPPRSANNPRSASARRAPHSRLEKDHIPSKLDRQPPFILNRSQEIRPERDVDWTSCDSGLPINCWILDQCMEIGRISAVTFPPHFLGHTAFSAPRTKHR